MNKTHSLWEFIKEFFQTKFLPATSREQLEKRQQLLWEKLKKNSLCKSKFYTPYLNQSHSKWPIINKADHMAAFNQINTVGLDKTEVLHIAAQSEISRDFTAQINDYSVGLSSGTSGNRGIFVASQKERAIWAANIIAKLLPIQFKKLRIAFFLRANNKLYETVNSHLLKFEFFDLLDDISIHINQLNEYQPNILIAPASVLAILANAKDKTLFIKPSKIISVAEVLTEEDKQKIEKKFNQLVHQVYQCTEGFLAATCKYGNLHLNEESVLFEKKWVDTKLRIFTPIVTDLKRQTQPIVRYHLDDLLVESPNKCPCNSPATHIEKILGRCDDVLYLNNTKDNTQKPLFPDFITRSIIQTNHKITDFQVIQKTVNLLIICLPLSQKSLFSEVVATLQQSLIRQDFVIPEMKYEQLKSRPLHLKNRRVQRLYEHD